MESYQSDLNIIDYSKTVKNNLEKREKLKSDVKDKTERKSNIISEALKGTKRNLSYAKNISQDRSFRRNSSKPKGDFCSRGTVNNVYDKNFNVLTTKSNSIQKYNFNRNENFDIGNSEGICLDNFEILGKNLGAGQYAVVRKA